ncbi:hypothetical protein V6N13_090087 [Hibiscus sabdariffa]
MAAEQPKPGCQSMCDVTIYTSTADPPKAFLSTSTIDVLHIDLDGEVRIRSWVSSDCYNSSGRSSRFRTWLRSGLYYISSTKNKFIAIGCDNYAIITGTNGQDYTTGCLSLCGGIDDVINGSCSGIGCCQASIPRGVRDYNISLRSFYNHSRVLSFNPCTFGFVVEEGEYTFSTSDLSRSDVRWKLPMVLDWTIGDQKFRIAVKPEKILKLTLAKRTPSVVNPNLVMDICAIAAMVLKGTLTSPMVAKVNY